MVAPTSITWQYMENVKSFFSENTNTYLAHNEKNVCIFFPYKTVPTFLFQNLFSQNFTTMNSRNFAMLFSSRNFKDFIVT
jgi:hypothetical protein